VERAVCFTGIGGQGVQLASQALARGALVDGREAQLFGSYGGMMRGGNTEATIVVADEAVESPPTVADAWAVAVMHHDYSAPTLASRRPGGLVAIEVGNVMAASVVMAGALASATGLVSLPALAEAVAEALPSYRRQHVELNRNALRAGAEAVPTGLMPAWGEPAAPARASGSAPAGAGGEPGTGAAAGAGS
jgi:Pyruvate/2-oxoacid:ferredoxin oxidoreductase gamma subunit